MIDARLALNHLKVQELKQICREHGVAPVGKKSELIDKLLQLRDTLAGSAAASSAPPPPQPVVQQVQPPPGYAVGNSSLPPQAPSARGGGGGRGRGGRGRNGKGAAAGRFSENGLGDRAAGQPAGGALQQPLKCVECGVSCDLQDQLQGPRPPTFWCPMCRFRLMDPFNAVVEPHGMLHCAAPANHSGRLEFTLELSELRAWRRENMCIQVRMVKVSYGKMAHNWPKQFFFAANGADVFRVEPPEEGHKRRDVPQDISGSLRVGRNTISIRVMDEQPLDFVIGIVLTVPSGIKELRTQIERLDKAPAMQRVQRVLAQQAKAGSCGRGDEIMCMAPDKLKLVCPITMDKIVEPVRGRECQHLQCFGLEAFLTSNRQMRAFNNRWVCPICSLVLRPPALVFDLYCAEILKATPDDAEEVYIDARSGNWQAVDAGKPKGPDPSPDSDVDEVDLASPSPGLQAQPPPGEQMPSLTLPPARAGTSPPRSSGKRPGTEDVELGRLPTGKRSAPAAHLAANGCGAPVLCDALSPQQAVGNFNGGFPVAVGRRGVAPPPELVIELDEA